MNLSLILCGDHDNRLNKKKIFFFYDNDIHKTLILNNKKTKQNKEQSIKTRLNIHRRSNTSVNAAQNI